MDFTVVDPNTKDAQKVTSDGYAKVSGYTQTPFAHQSITHQSAFSFYGKHTVASSATDEIVAFLRNDSSVDLVVDKIIFSSNSVDIKIEIHHGSVYTSGGEAADITNMNLKSSEPANVFAVHSKTTAITGTVDSTKELQDIRLGTGFRSFVTDFNGGLVLGRNNNLSILCEGTAGDKVRATIYFHFVSN
ncbi:MAG: hypothetical protein OEL89_00370 [Candidatus Peregrinibacteria bacterium]|nr:hypothetical protein [Candidatus Peregrinibacteria bacterium]